MKVMKVADMEQCKHQHLDKSCVYCTITKGQWPAFQVTFISDKQFIAKWWDGSTGEFELVDGVWLKDLSPYTIREDGR